MTSPRCVPCALLAAILALEGCSGTNIANVSATSGGESGSGGSPNAGSIYDYGGAKGTAETGGESTVAGTGGATPLVPQGIGGTWHIGGARATGGAIATGGARATGGAIATGGARATGGAIATGGARATGGAIATGGARATGGAIATGGAELSGGGSAVGTESHTNPLSQAVIDQFVVEHNAARSSTLDPPPSPALPPVNWDYALADSAYNYLSKCPGGNLTLAPHNPDPTSDYAALGGKDPVGENIYATTGPTVTPSSALNAWMSEASKYDYNTNNIFDAGHYTQVVWRKSVRIGCAIVNCPNYAYSNTILCDYAPAGNYENQKPY